MRRAAAPQVVVTGVSTGIGLAVAEDLLSRGYRVYGSVRREEERERLGGRLGSRFTPLLFDVRDPGAVSRAAADVDRLLEGAGLSGLVNNAGVASPGPVLHLSEEAFRAPFEVNVFGTLRVTRAFLPLLTARGGAPPGRVVNISSVSGWHTFPFNSAYSASKRALEALSDGLRRELVALGVDVVVIVPGSVRTPIWDKVAELDLDRYAGTTYHEPLLAAKRLRVELGRRSLPVENLARAVRVALEAPRPKARYRVLGSPLIEWILPMWLPDRLWDRLLWRMLGMKRWRG